MPEYSGWPFCALNALAALLASNEPGAVGCEACGASYYGISMAGQRTSAWPFCATRVHMATLSGN